MTSNEANTAGSPVSLIPEQMRLARRWLVWKAISKGEGKKPSKVPFYADGSLRSGKLDSPEDWSKLTTFETAQKVAIRPGHAGLGFALGPDGTGNFWQGIDFDGVDERPELEELAKAMPGFMEVSPSKKGLHAIGYGRSFDGMGSNKSGIEAYCGGRYFTVTGERKGHNEICDLADYIDATLRPHHTAASAKATKAEKPQAMSQQVKVQQRDVPVVTSQLISGMPCSTSMLMTMRPGLTWGTP